MTSLLIEFHDKEKYLLQRRLLLLSLFDDLAQNDDRCLEEQHADENFQNMKKQFSTVLTPETLCASIKRIYPPDQF
jgi:hypothetical protein